MIRRVGRFELVGGFTRRYGAHEYLTTVGFVHCSLNGGQTLHFVIGRFGIYAGYWRAHA